MKIFINKNVNMKHNLNSISLDEKERILEMHINAILKEQGTNLNVGGNFQQGQAKTQQSGQQAAQNLKAGVTKGLRTAKEVVVTIGKNTIKFVIIAGAVVVVIAETLYKISQTVFNAIIKFLTSIGKSVIGQAQVIQQATVDVFTKGVQKIGQVITAGKDIVTSTIQSMKDTSYNIIIYIIKLLKQFGNLFWGKALVMAATINEFGQNVWNWCKQQYNTIAKELGMAWDGAVNTAKQGFNALKNMGKQAYQNVKNVGNQALDYGKQTANKVANYAGQAYGAISGFADGLFNESIDFYRAYTSINSKGTFELINECSRMTKSVIL